MSRYAGVPCPVCNEKFEVDSDVVVCPICGAPHHRACYRQVGHCAFTEEHASGKVWASEVQVNDEEGRCPRCGGDNLPGAALCRHCGVRLPAGRPPSAVIPPVSSMPGADDSTNRPYHYQSLERTAAPPVCPPEFSPEQTMDEVPVKDIISFVGPNSRYYLRQFDLMKRSPFFLSFNLAAFLFNFLYFFYRKMYKAGCIYLAIFFLAMLPGVVGALLFFTQAGPFDPNTLPSIASLLLDFQRSTVFQQMYVYAAAAQVLFYVWWFSAPILANYLYYRHVIRGVRSLRGTPSYIDNPTACLTRKGGTAFTMVWVSVGAVIAFFLCYSTALSWFMY